MIEENKELSKEMESALKALEQAKAKLAKAKSKESDRLRKEDTHKKIIMGGIVKKYFPDCQLFDEAELNQILSVALATQECQREIQKIKNTSDGNAAYQKPVAEGSADEE